MVFRCNEKEYRWTANHSYNLKTFANKSKLSLPVKLVLVFLTNTSPGTRPVILKSMGVERFKDAGYLSGLFSVMTQNGIIKYSSKDKSYIRGRRYKEFLKDVERQLLDKKLSTLYKKEYVQILKEVSQSLHFITED